MKVTIPCLADVNCTDDNCTQGCAIIDGMETCFCERGFKLDGDNATCIGDYVKYSKTSQGIITTLFL